MRLLADRRAVLAGLAFSLAAGVARGGQAGLEPARRAIAAIERREGGRLGVSILDTASGAALGARENERFPMCSSFKWLAAAALLSRVDQGQEDPGREVRFGPADMLDYAPVARANLARGSMSLGDLCAAAIDWSDNVAANLVLAAIGGPAGLTAYARSIGDAETRLDRNEPGLNTAVPGDVRDTTTPRAMRDDLQQVLLGDALSAGSRRQLEDWMAADKVGDKRLRAGLPAGWRVADKTGTGDYGTANTVAAIWPPGRSAIIACVFYTESKASIDARNAIHRELGALIAGAFGG